MPRKRNDYEQNNPRLSYRVPLVLRQRFAEKARADEQSPSMAIRLLIEAYLNEEVELVPGRAKAAFLQPPRR